MENLAHGICHLDADCFYASVETIYAPEKSGKPFAVISHVGGIVLSSSYEARKFKVKVKGVTPYMQHRMDDATLQDWEKRRGTILERDNLQHEPERRAAFHAYINQEGEYFIPAEHFKQSFIKGGAFVKSKVGNSKKSMKNI